MKSTGPGLLRLVRPILLRPSLWLPAVKAAWRFRARDWYRRPPFLPLPPRQYVEWRLHTAYGRDARGPRPDELARYLRWADRMSRARGGGLRR